MRIWEIAQGLPRSTGIDTNGQYSKDNCRWASYAEQNNNRRYNKRLTINGETRTYAEWERSWV